MRNDANVVELLRYDGDFRSQECVELLKQADIVVTNPPFSLFTEYVSQLIEHDKQFLILGDQNAVSLVDIFSYFKQGRMWLGNDNGGKKWFRVPLHYDIQTEARKKIENGIQYFSMGRIVWWTNLDHKKRHEELILHKKFSPDEYPTYDNYDAIEVGYVADIPIDYDGEMGVPQTFLQKHNPDQFELVGSDVELCSNRFYVMGKRKYARIVIKRK